ncbi:unnamed protein product, partial [Nesidiocoris tenuis]
MNRRPEQSEGSLFHFGPSTFSLPARVAGGRPYPGPIAQARTSPPHHMHPTCGPASFSCSPAAELSSLSTPWLLIVRTAGRTRNRVPRTFALWVFALQPKLSRACPAALKKIVTFELQSTPSALDKQRITKQVCRVHALKGHGSLSLCWRILWILFGEIFLNIANTDTVTSPQATKDFIMYLNRQLRLSLLLKKWLCTPGIGKQFATRRCFRVPRLFTDIIVRPLRWSRSLGVVYMVMIMFGHASDLWESPERLIVDREIEKLKKTMDF